MNCKECNGSRQRPNGMPCELCEGTGRDLLSHETKELIYDHFAGGCQGIVSDFHHWDTGVFLANEDQVAEVLDDMEVFLCPVCGWWSHSGESYVGHGEDCSCEDGQCGECCEDNE